MRATIFDEPRLDFGHGGSHQDPRAGIADYGPVDLGTSAAPTRIRVGLVGPAEAISGARNWLERCRTPIEAKANNRHPRLFRGFPGFDTECSFRSELVLDDTWMRTIPKRQLDRILSKPVNLATAECVDLYRREIADLSDKGAVDVIVVARPDELQDDIPNTTTGASNKGDVSTKVDAARVDFHDLLKASSLGYGPPLQVMRSTTWDPTRDTAKSRSRRSPSIQDEATRAWNLHTALYYKAGGVPWRVQRHSADLDSLYVGVSFFHSTDRGEVHTSVAQVFDERGEGVVVRGGPAARTKEDRQPHLRRPDAEDLLGTALDTYQREHHHFPARVVLHKTSQFDDQELTGFEAAADQRHIRHLELLWIVDASVWVPIIRSWALTRGYALHPGTSCVALCTDSWRHWLGSPCGQVARRTSRSSCCATSSQSCTARTTDQRSPTRTGPCSLRSRQPCPDRSEPAGSSHQRPCCAGTDAAGRPRQRESDHLEHSKPLRLRRHLGRAVERSRWTPAQCSLIGSKAPPPPGPTPAKLVRTPAPI